MDPFQTVLGQIRAGDDVSPGGWDLLSALSGERYATFHTLWDSLAAEDRLTLLDSLHTEAEESSHLDFTPIWQLALGDPAAKVRGAGITYSADEEGQWLIEPLLHLAGSDPDTAVRALAAEALGRFAYLAEVGSLPVHWARRIEDVLLALAGRPDEDSAVRTNALSAVGYLSTPRVHSAIEAAYADPASRQAAIRAMGRNCDPQWTETLLAETSSGSAVLREEAARAIGEIEDARGVTRLLELLEDPAVGVRLGAIWALGEIGGEEAQEALIYCLEDPREAVREAAETALAEIAAREDPLTF